MWMIGWRSSSELVCRAGARRQPSRFQRANVGSRSEACSATAADKRQPYNFGAIRCKTCFDRIVMLSRRIGILLACTFALPASAASFLDFLFPKHDVQVITVTDTTPAGALLRPVSPANPVYYMAINAGYRDFGGIIAGEKIPPKDDVIKTIARVLAKRGYLPATDQHPPTLMLTWTWGTMNTDRYYDGNADGRQTNRQQLLRFLGAYKVGLISKDRSSFQQDMMPGLIFMDADAQAINEVAGEDLYIAAIAAYDYAAALERKEKKLLWMTKISCPSRGLSLPETLPAMLALAGPNIGRETAKPVWVTATEQFKTEVKIGDPSVVEYLDPKQPLPVFDANVPSAKDAKKSAPAAPKKKR
jgi:hypothetical protein